MNKLVLSLLTFGFVFPLLGLPSKESFKVVHAEGEENAITLSCSNNLVEGSQYRAAVSLKTYEEISAISLQVYFDQNAITINNTYNSLSSANVSIYDSSINNDNVAYSYIFNSIDMNNSYQLFYFNFTVNTGAVAGDYYFDVVVTEAYNSTFDNVNFNTLRKSFHITNKNQVKSARAYLSTGSSINKSINDEFEFIYYINSYEPSCGEFVITYDYQLFEFVSLTKLGFFEDMLFDYNANGLGQIRITFAAISQANNQYLFAIKLRTIANITTSAKITLVANELYDSEMNPMTFNASSLTVRLSFDSTQVDYPKMKTSFTLDIENKQISLDIKLEADSHLGAGDFVLTFDKTIVSYLSYTKHFFPTSFTVNDKEQQLEQGKVKFSIISTTDIVSATDIITFVFSYNESSQIQHVVFDLYGNGLTNSLTNPIELDVTGTAFDIDATDFILRWSKTYLYMDEPAFDGEGTGRCKNDGLYVTAKTELLKLDNYSIESFENNLDNKYTAELSRYLAWATACGDTSPFEGEGIIQSNSLNVFKKENNYILFVCAVTSSLFGLLTLLYIIKRRNSGAHNTK